MNGFVPRQGYMEVALFVAAVALLVAVVVSYGTAVEKFLLPVFLIAGVVAAIYASCRLVRKSGVALSPMLVASSFFIYVSHKLGATYVARSIFEILLPPGYLMLTLRFLVAPFVAVAMCVVVYMVLQRSCPKVLAVLIGRETTLAGN